MKKKVLFFAAIGLLSTTIAGISETEIVSNLNDAIIKGKPSLELQLAFEHSSTDDTTSPAKGLNLRTRLGYRTADYLSTNAFLQFHAVSNLIEDFRFPGGGDPRHDVIGDPDGERIHQVYFDFMGIPDTKLRLGRQEIILDDARLIGNVGWRQNGQSFDALSLKTTYIPNITLNGAVINQVNTIFLTHVDLKHLILLNGKYSYEKALNLALFAYLLDTEISAKTARDSATLGGRLNGAIGDTFNYDFTYAYQTNYADGENHGGEMINGFLGANLDPIKFGIGYSRISGKDGTDRPFDTLFSTAHKFNGWADQFLATNGGNLLGGLEDLYFQLGSKVLGTKIVLRYHLFSTTEGSANNTQHDEDYGTELDLVVKRKLTDNLSGSLKYAYYNETDANNGLNPTKDEEVVWARLAYKF